MQRTVHWYGGMQFKQFPIFFCIDPCEASSLTKTIDQPRAVAAVREAKRQAGRVIFLNPIPEGKWQYIRSVQTMASICPMVSCSTLRELASACRRLAKEM